MVILEDKYYKLYRSRYKSTSEYVISIELNQENVQYFHHLFENNIKIDYVYILGILNILCNVKVTKVANFSDGIFDDDGSELHITFSFENSIASESETNKKIRFMNIKNILQ